MKNGIEYGGCCPAGRLDEFGKVPDRYALKEGGSFADRTLQNVKDADATIVIYSRELRGGTEYTLQCCITEKRPHQLIDAAKMPAEEGAKAMVDLVRKNKIDILNVAGPRQSEWQGGYDYAFRTLEIFLLVAQRFHRIETSREISGDKRGE